LFTIQKLDTYFHLISDNSLILKESQCDFEIDIKRFKFLHRVFSLNISMEQF